MKKKYPRDLVGYGSKKVKVKWPGNAKLALQFVLNYEEGAENCTLHGDKTSEVFLSEIIGAKPIKGRHLNMESIYEYGSRRGFWRIHDLFNKKKSPDRKEIIDNLSGQLCRCGSHASLLKAVNRINKGPVALVHFDAHLDTWDTYFGAPYTHGTPFRRAREENLFLDDASMHVGIRGPLYSRDDIKNDESFGFKIIHCDEFQTEGTDKIAERIKKRVGDNPLYLSIDIDVLDPAFAPGTGTPEIAGMTSREMVNVIRGLSGMNLISADVVEVSPAYDHAEVTSLAAATIVYELTNLFAKK